MYRRSKGFTLVELLVVISIIGMLVGLLLPAVQSAREAGRRIDCTNRQHQISLAIMNYESSKGSFPGYVNELSGTNLAGRSGKAKVSWLIPLLPNLESMTLYNSWKEACYTIQNTGALPDPTTSVKVTLQVTTCPSNPTPSGVASSTTAYGVNTGRNLLNNNSTFATSSNPLIPAQGVFTDQFKDISPATYTEYPARVGLSFLSSHDGGTSTILLGEKGSALINPPDWADIRLNAANGFAESEVSGETPSQSENAKILGIHWANDSNTNSPTVGTFLIQNPTNTDSTADVARRLISNHPAGAVVTFCDSHTSFLRNDIDKVVFMQLMTPWDRGVGNDKGQQESPAYGIRNPLNTNEPVPPLDESRYN
jgi:prepilin-type N-terminal cleavage/methylation domain-containing protein